MLLKNPCFLCFPIQRLLLFCSGVLMSQIPGEDEKKLEQAIAEKKVRKSILSSEGVFLVLFPAVYSLIYVIYSSSGPVLSELSSLIYALPFFMIIISLPIGIIRRFIPELSSRFTSGLLIFCLFSFFGALILLPQKNLDFVGGTEFLIRTKKKPNQRVADTNLYMAAQADQKKKALLDAKIEELLEERRELTDRIASMAGEYGFYAEKRKLILKRYLLKQRIGDLRGENSDEIHLIFKDRQYWAEVLEKKPLTYVNSISDVTRYSSFTSLDISKLKFGKILVRASKHDNYRLDYLESIITKAPELEFRIAIIMKN